MKNIKNCKEYKINKTSMSINTCLLYTSISSVVPFCSHIDHPTNDVDVIVSERGVADLRGLSPKARAVLIIDKIASPKYQPL